MPSIQLALIQQIPLLPSDPTSEPSSDPATPATMLHAKIMLDGYSSLLEDAAQQGATLACLPAFAPSLLALQQSEVDLSAHAEYVPESASLATAQQLARHHQMVIILPLLEIDMPGIYYHSALVIDADGSYLGRYRQSHLQRDADGFMRLLRPGNLGFPSFPTAVGRLGIALGYDGYFPEVYRSLALAEAEIIIHATCLPSSAVPAWQLSQRAHALSNGVFIAAINPQHEEAGYGGASHIVDPRGEIVAQAQTAMLHYTMHPLDISQARHTQPFLRDRRPELYEDLVAL